MFPVLISSIFSVRKSSCIFTLFLINCIFQTIYSQTSALQKTPESTILELNKPLERELSGTQRHSYQIALSADQYVKILIEQRGIDVGARLYGTDGKQMADFDTELKSSGVEIIEFVPEIEGNYRFDVLTRYPLLPAGKYEIRLVDLHTASEKEKNQQLARTLSAASNRFFTAGKYDEAKKSIERAIEINKNEFGSDNQLMVLNLTQLARVADAQGSYDQAEKINQQVLAIEQRIFAADNPITANTLNYLAINYDNKEDYPKAIEYHQKALAMREKIYGQAHPIVAVSLLNLGTIYDALGDKSKALELYQQALNIQEKTVGTENFNMAVILNNIAKIYNDLDDFQKALPFAERSVAILEKIYQPDNPRIFDALQNLAECYVGLKNIEKAEPLYLRVLASREKVYGEDHPLTAHVLYNLGSLYALKNDPGKAETFYRRALQIRENKFGADSPAVSEVLSALAYLSANKGDINQSLKLQQRANEIDERSISLNLTVGSERQKLAYLNSLFEQTNQSIFLNAKFAPDNPLAIELALTTILRQKGRVLDAVSNNLTELRRRANPQDKELLDNLNKKTQQISELILNGAEDTPIAEHQLKIKTLTDEREKLEDEISRRVAGFYPKSQPVTLQAVQTAIPNDFALLEFAVYDPTSSYLNNPKTAEQRYVVYVVHNQGKIQWKDLGATKQIDEAINALRLALRDPKRKDVGQLARTVDEKIMQPVRTILDNSKQLFISPDGQLNLIPFEALVDEQNHYLIENYSFTYLSSGRDLLRLQTIRQSKTNPLVIANPSFGESSADKTTALETVKTIRRNRQSVTATRSLSDTYFAPLGSTAAEGRLIQEIFPDAKLLTGTNATETALKQTNAPKILHIATHGFFLQEAGEKEEISGKNNLTAQTRNNNGDSKIENPLLRSGLALTGANQHKTMGDDGILTALEASGLNLWGTKLVVLSACDTGLGEIKTGEGVYGLRRAFVLAGTETLLMSLWSVSDVVTRELMTNYYKNLKQGMGRGAALHKVQLEMLKRAGREHPFYWASFIQSGEWANLEGKK